MKLQKFMLCMIMVCNAVSAGEQQLRQRLPIAEHYPDDVPIRIPRPLTLPLPLPFVRAIELDENEELDVTSCCLSLVACCAGMFSRIISSE